MSLYSLLEHVEVAQQAGENITLCNRNAIYSFLPPVSLYIKGGHEIFILSIISQR